MFDQVEHCCQGIYAPETKQDGMTEKKHERIARLLRESLGEPGSTLPSEAEVAETYQVARNTARAALKTLEDEGLITAGVGTLRRVRKIHRWHWDMSGWEQPSQHRDHVADAWAYSVRQQGGDPWNQMEVLTVAATEEVADRLQIEPGISIQARRRRRMVNGQPHQLSESYFPPFVTDASPLFHQLGDTAAPGGLLAASGFQQVRWHDELTARMPVADETHQLLMARGTPLLVHTRVGYDADDRPLRYMVTRMAADQVMLTYDIPVDTDAAPPR